MIGGGGELGSVVAGVVHGGVVVDLGPRVQGPLVRGHVGHNLRTSSCLVTLYSLLSSGLTHSQDIVRYVNVIGISELGSEGVGPFEGFDDPVVEKRRVLVLGADLVVLEDVEDVDEDGAGSGEGEGVEDLVVNLDIHGLFPFDPGNIDKMY